MAGWIGLILLLAAGFYGVALFNGLVAKRNQVSSAWSQIDVQLKRRHDLVPNLVDAVKGYMAHEKTVLEEIVRARQQAVRAGNDLPLRMLSENQLTGALRSLFAVGEAYPDLKANKNVLALQEELNSTENRIAFARQHYADSVQSYNTARETFPALLIAQPLGFTAAPQFAIEIVADRAVPQIQLSS